MQEYVEPEKAKRTKTPRIVYFMAAWDISRVKIGTTTLAGLPRRLSQLMTANPVDIKLLGYHPGGRKEEREVHQRFASARIGGEWFDITPEIMDYVEHATTREIPVMPRRTRAGRAKVVRRRRQPIPAIIDHIDGSAVIKLKISADHCQTLYAIHAHRKKSTMEPELPEICGWIIDRAVHKHRRQAKIRAAKAMAELATA